MIKFPSWPAAAVLVSGSVEFFVGITSLDPSDVYLSAKVLYPEPRVMEIFGSARPVLSASSPMKSAASCASSVRMVLFHALPCP